MHGRLGPLCIVISKCNSFGKILSKAKLSTITTHTSCKVTYHLLLYGTFTLPLSPGQSSIHF